MLWCVIRVYFNKNLLFILYMLYLNIYFIIFRTQFFLKCRFCIIHHLFSYFSSLYSHVRSDEFIPAIMIFTSVRNGARWIDNVKILILMKECLFSFCINDRWKNVCTKFSWWYVSLVLVHQNIFNLCRQSISDEI